VAAHLLRQAAQKLNQIDLNANRSQPPRLAAVIERQRE
jgi:hypothetical protein